MPQPHVHSIVLCHRTFSPQLSDKTSKSVPSEARTSGTASQQSSSSRRYPHTGLFVRYHAQHTSSRLSALQLLGLLSPRLPVCTLHSGMRRYRLPALCLLWWYRTRSSDTTRLPPGLGLALLAATSRSAVCLWSSGEAKRACDQKAAADLDRWSSLSADTARQSPQQLH